jgi:nucleoside-diphosphate-sugar epimerase
MAEFKKKILVTGANGQIGIALVDELQIIYGYNNVIISDIRAVSGNNANPLFQQIDVTNLADLAHIVSKNKVTEIYHLAAILSANGEADPLKTWHINMQSLLNVLEVARQYQVKKVFIPSSIAVYGKNASGYNTSQTAFLEPSTVYGISKAAAESWCSYYCKRYGVDVRSISYPGVISYQSLPGGGTTDYAVDIFHKALSGNDYECYLGADTFLPMIYMNDAIRATIELMEADADKVKIRQLWQEIKVYYPDFNCVFKPDYRQSIADSWPKSIDDTLAYIDWGWKPEYDLKAMVADMIVKLKNKYLFAQTA